MPCLTLRRFFPALLIFLCSSFASTPAWADDRAAVRLVVQDFYKGYAKAEDCPGFVAKSKHVTPGFKKVYARYMDNGPEADPIINAQDFPPSGYQATEVKLEETKATVTVVTQDKDFAVLKVYLLWDGKDWLINGVNQLRGK